MLTITQILFIFLIITIFAINYSWYTGEYHIGHFRSNSYRAGEIAWRVNRGFHALSFQFNYLIRQPRPCLSYSLESQKASPKLHGFIKQTISNEYRFISTNFRKAVLESFRKQCIYIHLIWITKSPENCMVS